MEGKIFFIGVRKIHSNKKDTDFYMADYVMNDVPKTEFIDVNSFNNIAQKVKDKAYKECVGIFSLNGKGNVNLIDIK